MDTLRLYLVTWNVATKNPGQDLNSLLDFPSQFNKNKPLPDFYVIGLQEVKSQPQNMLLDTLFSDPWTAGFNKILCRQGYINAKSMRLQGILILVYARMKHVTHLRDIEAQYTKTGLGGLWGNKGAVSVRFNLYGCSICLVNSHLAAHEHLLAERINDYNAIVKQHNYHVRETANIMYHDYVFWLGDLNFRTDHPTGSSPTSDEIVEVLKGIEKDKYDSLLCHDQLLAVMDTGEAFSEFTEADITFPPTYKFNIGTDDYDTKRKPSWTDRILYKVIANNYENITLRADLVSYNHMPHYTVSDHKPVVAQFNIKIRNAYQRSITRPSRNIRSGIRMRTAMMMPPSGVVDQADTVENVDPDAEGVESTGDGEVVGVEDGEETEGVGEGEEIEGVGDEEEGLGDGEEGVGDGEEEVEGGEERLEDYEMNEDADDDEAFANYTEKTVEFAPITRIWYIGDADFRIQCTLSPDVEINAGDWCGIYDADFESLDDYIAYEYLSKVQLPSTPVEPGQPRTITLSFSVGSGVREPGFYRLIYFSQPSGEVRSILGISEPFEVCSREDQLVSLEVPEHQPSSSSSSPRSKSKPTDIFTDFTGLDVAKLSRHFSNDLSID